MKISASFETLLLAIIFVLIWSSAPVFTKLGLMYTSPFVFLVMRLTLASAILLTICFAMQAPWPQSWAKLKLIIISGLLFQVLYLGCSFYAISLHTPPALFAIILGTQPMLTALICGLFFKDTITSKQWIGLVLGFVGLIIVTANSLSLKILSWQGLVFLILALMGITFGTIYQKRAQVGVDHRTTCALQNIVGILPMLVMALWLTPMTIDWTWSFALAMFWMVIPTSVIAFIILYALIKRGDVTKVSSIFYIMPPCTAIMSYFMFGEKLTQAAMISLVFISVSIFMVNHK